MAATPFLLIISAALTTYGLIALARPILCSYALAHPNHRSSHTAPTPQGGGIFVIGTTVAAAAVATYFQADIAGEIPSLAWVLAATIVLAIVGAVDDVRTLHAVTRLILQAFAVAIVVATLPAELRILPVLPWWIEHIGILLAILWFVNLVNFMDGIDWITFAETLPVTSALVAFGLMGALPGKATVIASALCGAMIGFAPFNRPLARLFLGDVGSLPIGLLLGWLLIMLAGSGHLAAALLLPLYYVADASITLLRRFAKGEPVMKAHRSHFYQRATDGGFSIYDILGRIFALNCILIALATATILAPSLLVQMAAAIIGCILVGLLLDQFARGKRQRPSGK